MKHLTLKLCWILIPLLLCRETLCAEITVSAEFSPSQIALGDTAEYIVLIKESDSSQAPEAGQITQLPISQPLGLTLSNGRTAVSRQTNITNFKAEYSTTLKLSLNAQPDQIGSYDIQSFSLQYKGKQIQIPASNLLVLERGPDAGPPAEQLITLKAELPEKLYLGQTYNIELKLYLYETVSYRDHEYFERNADGFTVSDLIEPTASSEIMQGLRYRVITWPLTITPIQSGWQDIGFKLAAVVVLPQQANGPSQSPFFGQNRSFGGGILKQLFAQTERIDLATQAMQIEVIPLPKVDQPESFSGAVGNFNLQVFADKERSELGEPVTVSIKIVGEGNFSRINGPELPKSSQWRSYKPDSVMKTDGSNPLRGAKRFDYIMIPLELGQLAIPPIEFSYLDPSSASYVTLQTPAFAVEVIPSSNSATVAMSASDTDNSLPLLDTSDPDPSIELSTELELERQLQPGRSIGFAEFKQPVYYIANLFTLLLLSISCYQCNRRRKLRCDSIYALRQSVRRSLKQARKSAIHAAKTGNADSYYAHAQASVRCALTYKTGRNYRTAELNTIEHAWQQLDKSADSLTAVRELFNRANMQRFSTQSAPTSSAELKASQQKIDSLLKAL